MSYYLDTTAHLERYGGEQQVQDAIAAWLGEHQHYTSTHVEREWKRIVYGSTVDILNALPGAQSLADVRARLRQGFGREPAQRWMVYDMVIDDETSSIEELDRRARRFLRTGFHAMFTDRIEVRDGSRCGIAPREAAPGADGRMWFHGTCRKTETICDQLPFLDDRRDNILAAADALERSDRDEHRKLGQKARKLMVELQEAERKGANCYGGKGLGGDISIAVECGRDEVLLTTDHSFEHICPAMGLHFRRFDGTRMPTTTPGPPPKKSKRGGRGRR